jgi:hypothetical protein
MSLKEMIRSLKKLSRSQKLIRKRSKRKSKRKNKKRSRRRTDGNMEAEYGCKVPKSFI